MPIPSSPTDAETTAVNEILMSVGQAPVTKLENTNPDVALAYETLISVSKEVQAEGWTFNKEYNNTSFRPEADSTKADYQKIKVDRKEILQIDLSNNPSNAGKDSVLRGDYVYDRQNHTYLWDYAPTFDVLRQLKWGELPVPVRDYVVARASTIFSSRIVGDPTQYQLLKQKEEYNRAMAMEYECNQGDYTFFGHPEGGNFYVSYQPYNAIYRH